MAAFPTNTLTLLAVLGTTSATALAGQTCLDGEVSAVIVTPHSIFDTDTSTEEGSLSWVLNLANGIHADTNEGFLRGELLFEVGDCYDPFLVGESERLIRQLGFISRVDVRSERQPDGSVHVVVETWDRWTLQVEPRIRLEEGFEFLGVDVSERNLLGRGMTVGAFYREDRERLAIGGNFSTTRLLGTRWDAGLQGSQTRNGSSVQQVFAYPFVGEVGRYAAIQSYSRRKDLFSYTLAAGGVYSHVVQPFRQRSMEMTVAGRRGRPGRLSIFGVGLSREEWRYPAGTEVVQDLDFGNAQPAPPLIDSIVAPQLRGYSTTRLNLVLAQRNISFEQRDRLDFLRSVQDVATGGEVALVIGRSLPFLGSNDAIEDSDVFGRLRAFAGLTSGGWVLASAISIEGRHVFDGSEGGEGGWKDMLGEFDVYAYWRPTETSRHTFFSRVSGTGGWSVTGPFQLTLGGSSGVRGYSVDGLPGGRRLIASLEDRIYLGSPGDGLVDLGLTVFGDAGQIWDAGVPFGADSSFLTSGGAGLRLGFPGGTRGLTRIDLAFPLNGPNAFSQPTFRVSAELLGLRRGVEDRQLRRARRTSVGPGILPDPSVGR